MVLRPSPGYPRWLCWSNYAIAPPSAGARWTNRCPQVMFFFHASALVTNCLRTSSTIRRFDQSPSAACPLHPRLPDWSKVELRMLHDRPIGQLLSCGISAAPQLDQSLSAGPTLQPQLPIGQKLSCGISTGPAFDQSVFRRSKLHPRWTCGSIVELRSLSCILI